MTGKFIIDNTDIYTAYGAYLLSDQLGEIAEWPAVKDIDSVSWAESDYVQADLEALYYKPREIKLMLALRGDADNLASFYAWLKGKPTRHYNIAYIGREYDLRLIASNDMEAGDNLQIIELSLSEDNPYNGYSYVAPTADDADTGYELDGEDLSKWGVVILQGTRDSIERAGEYKERLVRDISVVNGVISDNGAIAMKVKAKEIVLNCAIRSETLSGLWKNYDALLYDLTKADAGAAKSTDKCCRELYCPGNDMTYYCYYLKQEVQDLSIGGGKNWIVFELHLVIIGEKDN